MAAVPVVDFSATPTSGNTSTSISFTDSSTNSPTGWAWYFGDDAFSNGWVQRTSAASWTIRCAQTSVTLPDGSIVLMGGTGATGLKNDVWRSTDAGATWSQQTAGALWSVRYDHNSVVMPDGSIVLMAGRDAGSYKNDTYRSTDKGASWSQQTAEALWTARFCPTSVALSDGSIVLMGGLDSSSNYQNDTYRSTDYGATWSQMTSSAGWTARYASSSAVLPDGSIVIMGGFRTGGPLNDVWRSSDKGATWSQMTANAGWTARYAFSSAVLPDGSIVIMGGYDKDGNHMNNVWRSADNGATWTQLTSSAAWSGKAYQSSAAIANGSIIVMGGVDSSDHYTNDVWYLETATSFAKNPTHTYSSNGNYKVSLQAYNSDGYSNSIKTDYITISQTLSSSAASGIGLPVPVPTTIPTPVPPPIADFSAPVTMGMAPLSVAFIDQSVNNPSSWYWSFGDQTMSTLQHPIHVYSSPGVYTVSLTATNAGGSHSKTRISFITINKTDAVTDFTGVPTSGNAPLTVAFTDRSGNKPVTWRWSFGDGMISTEQNPVYVYKKPGSYTVSLTTTNVTGGTGTKTRNDYISVINNSHALIVSAITPNSGIKNKIVEKAGISGSGFNSGTTVRLTKSGKADIVATSVSFISANKISCNIDLSGAETGTWNVVVTNSDGKSGSLANGFTIKSAAPVAAFDATPTSGGVPLKVTFMDKSSGDRITSRIWQYKLNLSSVWMTVPFDQSKSLTISSAGSYDIKLTVKGTDGSDDEIKTNYINAGCDFSKQLGIERCFGGIGDQCWGANLIQQEIDFGLFKKTFTINIVPVEQNQNTCLGNGWMSVGSIRHDKCCIITPTGKLCNGNFFGNGCEDEWNEAQSDTICSQTLNSPRQWPVTFGPYFYGNNGDDTTADLKAPSGTKVAIKNEKYCQSGQCKKDCNGNPIKKTDSCGEYCECSEITDSIVCNKNPVLILHGISDSVTNVYNSRLYAELSKTHKVYAIDYLSGPGNAYGDIRDYAHTLDNKIKEIKKQTNSEKVDIVAHSMGGLISRYRIQNIPDGEDDVGKLIMIGTPNHGSQISDQMNYCLANAAYCAQHAFDGTYKQDNINQAINEMYPGSEFLYELNGNRATSEDVAKGGVSDKTSNKVRYSVIAANYILNGDGAVMFDSAKLSGVPIYPVRASHIEQFSHQEVIDKVIEILADDDSSIPNKYKYT